MGFLAALGGIAKTFFAKKAVQQIVVPAAVNALVGRANQKAANKASVAAYEQNKKDAANKYVDMSKAARKAGFNPLTVLRATGGAGFGSYGAPILSKRAFGLEFAANSISGFAKMKANEPIDLYNEEVRQLDLESRKLDIKLGKAQLDQINAPDVYAGYGQYIPVKNGVNIQLLDVTVAKRLGIKPNDRLTAGDLEEILGEFHGSLQGAVGSRTGTEALKPHNQSGGKITKDRLSPIATDPAMQGWVDNIWNGITQANPLGGILSTPGVISGKTPGEKWPFNKF